MSPVLCPQHTADTNPPYYCITTHTSLLITPPPQALTCLILWLQCNHLLNTCILCGSKGERNKEILQESLRPAFSNAYSYLAMLSLPVCWALFKHSGRERKNTEQWADAQHTRWELPCTRNTAPLWIIRLTLKYLGEGSGLHLHQYNLTPTSTSKISPCSAPVFSVSPWMSRVEGKVGLLLLWALLLLCSRWPMRPNPSPMGIFQQTKQGLPLSSLAWAKTVVPQGQQCNKLAKEGRWRSCQLCILPAICHTNG